MFRSANRQVQKHIEAERKPQGLPAGLKLRFYCECSNLACRDRIAITVDEYQTAGPGRKEFIVVPGHENTEIEDVKKSSKTFVVVEKHLDPAVITAEY